MHFVALLKFKKKPDKAFMIETQKLIDADTEKGFKFHNIYWMLGKYDAVAVYEAPSEKEAMKAAMKRVELMDVGTFVAIPREEVKRLVE